MDAAVIAVASFGSAVVGAVVGFAGAVFMERQRVRRTRVGIVRAVLGELRENASTALQVLHIGGRATEYSAETWRVANFELAQFVSDALYRKLLHIYSTLGAIERFSDQIGNDNSIARLAKKTLECWLTRINEAMNELLGLPEAAKFREEWRKLPSLKEEAARSLVDKAARRVLGNAGDEEGEG